jgi:hypothetical protein
LEWTYHQRKGAKEDVVQHEEKGERKRKVKSGQEHMTKVPFNGTLTFKCLL